jgi:hypothetical protein
MHRIAVQVSDMLSAVIGNYIIFLLHSLIIYSLQCIQRLGGDNLVHSMY